jgi:hypothetical protein
VHRTVAGRVERFRVYRCGGVGFKAIVGVVDEWVIVAALEERGGSGAGRIFVQAGNGSDVGDRMMAIVRFSS